MVGIRLPRIQHHPQSSILLFEEEEADLGLLPKSSSDQACLDHGAEELKNTCAVAPFPWVHRWIPIRLHSHIALLDVPGGLLDVDLGLRESLHDMVGSNLKDISGRNCRTKNLDFAKLKRSTK